MATKVKIAMADGSVRSAKVKGSSTEEAIAALVKKFAKHKGIVRTYVTGADGVAREVADG